MQNFPQKGKHFLMYFWHWQLPSINNGVILTRQGNIRPPNYLESGVARVARVPCAPFRDIIKPQHCYSSRVIDKYFVNDGEVLHFKNVPFIFTVTIFCFHFPQEWKKKLSKIIILLKCWHWSGHMGDVTIIFCLKYSDLYYIITAF